MSHLNKLVRYTIPFLILVFIYSLRPIFTIRFAKLSSEIIGGFAENTETYLCKKLTSRKKIFQLDIFCFGYISNIQLSKMIKRKLIIMPNSFIHVINLNIFFSKYFDFPKKHIINLSDYRDVDNLYSKFPPNLSFTSAESKIGWEILEKIGVPRSSKFICLIIRDDEYKKKTSYYGGRDFSYHDYRDFDSDKFLSAAEYLANQGLYVLRMGKIVKKPFFSKNKMVIDYANSEFRSDFMDIFLSANCEFCFTTGTGLDCVSNIFRRPIAAIVVPLGYIQNYNENFISITKHHIMDGKKLNSKEIFENDLGFLLNSKMYKDKNVILVEPTEQEISKFAEEAYNLFIKRKKFNSRELEIQKNYRIKFREFVSNAKINDPNYKKLNNRIQPEIPRGFFGINFIEKNDFF